MKKTKNTLLVLLWTVLALSMLVVVLFETDVLEFGFYSSSSEQAEFLLTTMMELLTLVSIPVSLKLFKWKQIHTDLVRRKEKALLKWGILRLLLLLAPLFATTLLYYMYANVAFGYMAIILVIVLPFVYPSMERCIAETSDEE